MRSQMIALVLFLPLALARGHNVKSNKSIIAPLSSFANVFSFGDSYSTTFSNRTTSNGNVWVEYLYEEAVAGHKPVKNQSATGLHNFARSGAAVNNLLLNAARLASQDLVSQVRSFNTAFAKERDGRGSKAWTSNGSLFTIWTGINVSVTSTIHCLRTKYSLPLHMIIDLWGVGYCRQSKFKYPFYRNPGLRLRFLRRSDMESVQARR